MQQVQLTSAANIKFVFEGKEYLARKPRLAELRQLDKDTKDNPAAAMDAVSALIVSCGLPQEVLDQLDMDGIEAIQNALISKKKDVAPTV